MDTSQVQLDSFIDRYDPAVAACGRAVLDALGRRLPQAWRLVYDNYNALAVGFSPSERTSEAIVSVVLYPRWVSLFFLQGARLEDPHRLLKGSGSVVRHVVVTGPEDLDRPGLAGLLAQALAKASPPLPVEGAGPVIIKSVSARQRPRRPPPATSRGA